MKIVYEISKSDLNDRKNILILIQQFIEFKKSLSDYGYKLIDEGSLSEINDILENIYSFWINDQHKRMNNIMNELLKCGEVSLKEFH